MNPKTVSMIAGVILAASSGVLVEFHSLGLGVFFGLISVWAFISAEVRR